MQLTLQQDLFGAWSLLREWGQTGGRTSARRDLFEQQHEAEAALERVRAHQSDRGFQVMFTRGADAPDGYR